MAKITYENKVALNQNPNIPDINKVNDTDMNMIKNVVNNNETKVLLAVSSSAPATCDTGEIYFNTTDNLIYTATATNTWGSTGVAPTENTIYIEFTTQTAYAYDGTTLVSVGGGTGSSDIVMVYPDTPTEDTKLYIEESDLDFNGGIPEDIYSTSEIKTNKIWIDGKSIYRKVINVGVVSTSAIDTGITNFERITQMYGTAKLENSYWIELGVNGAVASGVYCNMNLNNDGTQLTLTKSNNTINNCIVIIEYTKTS